MTRPRVRRSVLAVLALSLSARAEEPAPAARTPPPKGDAEAAGTSTPSAPAGAEPSGALPRVGGSPEAAVSAPPPPAGPAPAPPTVVSVVPAAPPTDAAVHVACDYSDAWLEGRSRVDLGPWERLCAAPCDRTVRVDGLELRVVAEGMTPSNHFVVDPGGGTARLRVAGGSSSARNLGIMGLAIGLPVTFGGMTLFGVGSLEDERGVRTAGIVTLSVGAAAIVAALPLLLFGSTTVKNEQGRYIAEKRLDTWVF